MPTRMLIDAAHAEETRVVVLSGKKLEEFDFESSTKKQLKGNIYLAKVTRVEPSLQAAFLDYGGNRHGFLPFSEIHPDYYQIPTEDRQALLDEEAAIHAEEEPAAEGKAQTAKGDGEESVESLGEDDELEEVRAPRQRPRRHYKIQEVIKRRQILLVQVVKEERGNKGAALTTYLSLAGRYCVLMPNTSRGGGVSRKISNPQDRKRLKSILADLSVPEGMACIIRTAGTKRTKPEIRRDYEYLLRLWDSIRQLTLKSMAPALIYEEGNLIKRAIRDIYSRDIDEIYVEGEEGYRMAKNFMRMLMPSHAKKVQHYTDRIPLFHRYQVEGQLDSMFSPVVELKSGGYIVINPTEALVAVDVNSGRATREHNIEETAFKTNLEAAEEIARQLRLRDMAGLVVIDFIDMEENRNIRAVEKKMKDCLKSDRARIQVGRISHFGLMELSRQRLRPGLLEASTAPCQVCQGTGIVRSIESSALQIVRALEEEGIRERSAVVDIAAPQEVAFFLLNEKRRYLAELENRFGFEIRIHADPELLAPQYRMEREGRRETEKTSETITPESMAQDEAKPDKADAKPEEKPAEESRSKRRRRRRKKRTPKPEEKAETPTVEAETSASAEAGEAAAEQTEAEAATAESEAKPEKTKETAKAAKSGQKSRSRRGRSRKKTDQAKDTGGETAEAEAEAQATAEEASPETGETPAAETPSEEKAAAEKSKKRSSSRRRKPKAAPAETKKAETEKAEAESPAPATEETTSAESAAGTGETEAKPEGEAVPEPEKPTAAKGNGSGEPESGETAETGEDTGQAGETPPRKKPSRRGWWQRAKNSLS